MKRHVLVKPLDAALPIAMSLVLIVLNALINPDSVAATLVFTARNVRIEIVSGEHGLATHLAARSVDMGVPRRKPGLTK